MRRDVIQIMKHNGDSDASLKPCFLPDVTAVSSTPSTGAPNVFPPPLPAPQIPNRTFPSHLFWGRARTELLGWIISFPWVFATRKISLFVKDLSVPQPPQCHLLITRHDAEFSHLKGFEGERGYRFLCLLFPDLSQSRVIIHSLMAVRDDACYDIFPSAALLSQIQGGRDCQRPTSAAFSRSLSSVRNTSQQQEK